MNLSKHLFSLKIKSFPVVKCNRTKVSCVSFALISVSVPLSTSAQNYRETGIVGYELLRNSISTNTAMGT